MRQHSEASNTFEKLTLFGRSHRVGSNTMITSVKPCPTKDAACDRLLSSRPCHYIFGDWIRSKRCACLGVCVILLSHHHDMASASYAHVSAHVQNQAGGYTAALFCPMAYYCSKARVCACLWPSPKSGVLEVARSCHEAVIRIP
jgi:hypothetical protein